MSLQKPDKNLLLLATKWLTGTITGEEKAKLDQWYNHFDDSQHDVETSSTEKTLEHRIHQAILKKAGMLPEQKSGKLWPRLAVAASLLILLSAGGYWIFKRPLSIHDTNIVASSIKAGGNKAYLTLGNGKKISLNDVQAGQIAEQAGVQITKSADGQLVYTIAGDNSASSSVYNTVETPRGGQYQLILPDGSKVWLNAASSLRFPASFIHTSKRRVTLHGEAYFEVAKDKQHPFCVETDRQHVEVLGTTFNINSYTDETAVRTTLLEGSVRVSNLYSKASSVLKPGQQSLVSASTLIVKDVETDDEVAWKNGYFMFNNERLESIMNQVSRWYNIEIVFRDHSLKNKKFFGSVNRYANLSDLLKILQETNVATFDIEGQQIIISVKK